MEWISVKDKLPETIKRFTTHGDKPYVHYSSEDVLILLNGKVEIKQLLIDKPLDGTEQSSWGTGGEMFLFREDVPTHWCPIPEFQNLTNATN